MPALKNSASFLLPFLLSSSPREVENRKCRVLSNWGNGGASEGESFMACNETKVRRTTDFFVAEFSRDFLEKTIKVWQSYGATPVSLEDAREIAEKMTGLFFG